MATPAPAADLHALALDAEHSLASLATGLAHAGAPPDATAAVTKMADVTRQIAGTLGQGAAAQPHPVDAEDAAEGPEPPGPPDAEDRAEGPEPANTIAAATHALHKAAVAHAQNAH